MRLVLNLVLIVTVFVSCYTEFIYLHFVPPQIEKKVHITLRAHLSFYFDQEKAFGGKRNLAISQYIPLYRFLPDRVSSAKKKMEELIARVTLLQGQELIDAAAFSKFVKKETGMELSPETASRLLGYADFKRALEGLATLLESSRQSRIVEDLEPLKGKSTIEVHYPDPVGTIAYPAAEFMTLDKARSELRKKADQLFWHVDKTLLEPTVGIALAMLQPNLGYDRLENDRRIEEISRRYPSKIVHYKAGEVLVPIGKPLTEQDVLLLEATRLEERRDFLERSPWIFLVIVLTVLFYNLMLSKIIAPWNRGCPPYVLLCTLVLVAIVLMKACMLFTSVSVYALPMGFLSLLLLLLYPERVSVISTAALGALLMSLLCGRTLDVVYYFSLGALATTLLCPRVSKGYHILVTALALGGFNAVIIEISMIDWSWVTMWLSGMDLADVASHGRGFEAVQLSQVAWAFVGGMASGPLALFLLPVFELACGTASAFKLNRYTDLEHPLMRDLLVKAPGTYQHAMTVAYLAQAVGEAVGADTLLLRAGAYYHDIGKMANPGFFIENQFGGKNPHDEMDPEQSCKLIIDHVRQGTALARKAGLPEVLTDFIPQHHGTLLVEYFYNKACKASPGERPSEADYRYPGPKPQSVEAAILMISDAVEAVSRTIQGATREKIQAAVRFVVERRILDGQLDECDLSTRDIGAIVESLTVSLEAANHARVQYPWQKDDPGDRGR